jgi:hypothetical protein
VAQGRAALLFFFVGIVMLVRLAWLLIPTTESDTQAKEEQDYVEWQPIGWRRLFVPALGVCVALLLTFLLELSYSSLVQQNIIAFTLCASAGGLMLRGILARTLNEELLSKPLSAAYLAILIVCTQGALVILSHCHCVFTLFVCSCAELHGLWHQSLHRGLV